MATLHIWLFVMEFWQKYAPFYQICLILKPKIAKPPILTRHFYQPDGQYFYNLGHLNKLIISRLWSLNLDIMKLIILARYF